MRFNSAPINGAAFNADVPGGQPEAPVSGGGGSFPLASARRGTALFATERRPEPAVVPSARTPVAAAAPGPAAAPALGRNLLHHLFRPAAPDRAAPTGQPEPALAMLLVQIDITMLRLEIAVMEAIRRDEEDEAIAILLLSDA